MRLIIHILFILTMVIYNSESRKHHLDIMNDDRRYFPISTFGFYRSGQLQVNVKKFKILPQNNQTQPIGFSLEKMSNRHTEQHPDKCQLTRMQNEDAMVQHVYFLFDLPNKLITLKCSKEMENLNIVRELNQIDGIDNKRPLMKSVRDNELFSSKQKRSLVPGIGYSLVPGLSQLISRSKRAAPTLSTDSSVKSTTSIEKVSPAAPKVTTMATAKDDSKHLKCNNEFPITFHQKEAYYNFSFVVLVLKKKEEGLYNLNFHNCYNYDNINRTRISLELEVVEVNPDHNYLSAGEMPLPALFFMMSILFFLSACFWFFILKKSKDPVFKIHYLMGVVVVIKALSLLFHGKNYHFIQTEGIHMEAWAVMYYIMHLLKGALLFTVLALIGSGWAFIKHVLSSKEKKIFMMVIPLQIIANVATIIIEETEESNAEHEVWVQLLYLIDFLCCVAILLPVVWSIRHLQEASQTNGKAAINLRKLKLFRHFYIMIVCYIYFTRIIVSLLRITVPYQYEWLYEMFNEMATYVFFVMIGYKFRPANNNPYFVVDSEEEEDMDEVLTKTGLTEGLTRINQKGGKQQESGTRKKYISEHHVDVYQDEDEINLLSDEHKESSHEYD